MIVVRDVSFRYPPLGPQDEGLSVFEGLSFEVAAGERVALMGATGAGKTTLALLLAGLLPSLSGGTLHGTLQVAGRDVRATPAATLSTDVGLVFQEADHQLFNMTVEDEVAFGLEGLGLPAAEIEERIAWVLARVGLEALRERATWQLSGGQQRRLALASIIAMRPRVLLLDEPMAGLDPLGRRAVAALLDELKGEQETTILVIEQDAEWVARWADRVLALDGGRIAQDGPTRTVLSDVPALARFAVQPPQIAELAAALALPGQPLTSTEAAPLVEAQNAKRLAHREAARERGSRGEGGQGEEPDTVAHQFSCAEPPITNHQSPITHLQPSLLAIAAHDLRFRYPDGPVALTGVTLEIPVGQFVALVGPNGGGKTTFAKHLNGLLRPSGGTLRLFGEATAGRRVGELARQVGYLFQNPDLQIFAVTVREELAFGPRNLGLSEAEIQARVGAALERFDLVRWADAPPAVLGYGVRRLVTLAATWTMQPPVWVLDEPTTGLDAHGTARLVAEMRALHVAGHTLLLVTHDLRLVAALAERLVVIAGGQVALDGSPRTLLAEAAPLRPFELRPPPVTRLAGKLPWMPNDVLTVEEFVARFQATSA